MASGKKKSTFYQATLPLTGDESIDFIQNGVNKRSKISDLPGIQSILAGSNIIVDNTDPQNPFISAILSQSGKYLINGGAAWSRSGLTYDVSNLNYYWNGLKTSLQTQVTLAASDPTNNRLDAIVVDEAGNVSVITGTPSGSPITPAIPDSQLLVQYILVDAASIAPSVTQDPVYLENTEWATSNYTTSGTPNGSTNFAATDAPKQGSVCIDNLRDIRTGVRFVRSSTIDLSTFNYFIAWVRFSSAIASNKNLYARFEDNTGTLIGNQVNLFSYGVNKNTTTTWQLVVIPVTAFGGITTVKGLKMILTGGTNTLVEWDLDNIVLSTGDVAPTSNPVINFYKDGTKIGSQSGLNIAHGTGMTINAVEDAVTGIVTYTFNASGSASPDATTMIKGIVKLAGDLGGTADLPTVPGLANKLDISAYNDRFKGKYTSLAALQAAYPTANAGDYGQVDAGAGSYVVNYNYDVEDGWVIGSGGSGATNTDALPEGSTNLYFTNARAIAAVDISGKVDKNTAITGATKTKITFDAKGLVTAGADATTSDIAEGSNLYYTDTRARAAITGTTNRVTVTTGVVDIAGTYVGQSSITTLGTIATGTWSATTIASNKGGTGFTTYATGDLIYASATNTLSKLAAGTNGQVLTLASGVPTWAAAAGGGSGWGLTGTSGTDGGTTNYLGTSDNFALSIRTNAIERLYIPTSGGIQVTSPYGAVKTYLGLGTANASSNTMYISGGGSINDYFSGGYVLGIGVPGNVLADFSTLLINFYKSVNLNGNSLSFGQWQTIQTGSYTGLNYNGGTGWQFVIKNSKYSNYPFFIDSEGSLSLGGNTGVDYYSSQASSLLTMKSTVKGFLPPRMTTTQRDAIASPAEGLIIYNTTTHKLNVFTTAWEQVTSA